MLDQLLLPYSKVFASAIVSISITCVLINMYALYRMYSKRSLRSTSTAIIVCNLACVDVLVTVKDIPRFLGVIREDSWIFDESWCRVNGLTSVIFIIVSVTTLATISSERFSRLRKLSTGGNTADANPSKKISSSSSSSINPLCLGFVIAHTTLSYSLSLLWSKYKFVSRKAACKVNWPSTGGSVITVAASCIFAVPVSVLLYNVLVKTLESNNISKNDDERNNEDQKSSSTVTVEPSTIVGGLIQKTKQEIYNVFEERAQSQIQIGVLIFLFSWTPYVVEGFVGSYVYVHPNLGLIVAFIPVVMTSLLPMFYVCQMGASHSKVVSYRDNGRFSI